MYFLRWPVGFYPLYSAQYLITFDEISVRMYFASLVFPLLRLVVRYRNDLDDGKRLTNSFMVVLLDTREQYRNDLIVCPLNMWVCARNAL